MNFETVSATGGSVVDTLREKGEIGLGVVAALAATTLTLIATHGGLEMGGREAPDWGWLLKENALRATSVVLSRTEAIGLIIYPVGEDSVEEEGKILDELGMLLESILSLNCAFYIFMA